MIYLLISRQFNYEKKYPAEGHKFLNNLRFLMICINFKKNFQKSFKRCHLYSMINKTKKKFSENIRKTLCYAANQTRFFVYNFENMQNKNRFKTGK